MHMLLTGECIGFMMNGGLLINNAASTLNRCDTEDSQSGVNKQNSVGENGPFRLQSSCRRQTLVNIPRKGIVEVVDVD